MVNKEKFQPKTIHSTDDIKEGTELFHTEKMGKSPLTKVGSKEHGYFVVLGKYRITEAYNELDDLNKYLQEEPEDFLVRVCSTIVEITLQAKTETMDARTPD